MGFFNQPLKTNHHSYQEYGHDIHYCTTYSPDNPSPQKIKINGKVYTRFLDFIYMPCETFELTREQCIAVNNVRNMYYETHGSMSINKAVKRRISMIVNALCGNAKKTLLDYGCGYQTLRSQLDVNITYIGADINLAVIQNNREKDPKASYVIVDENQLPFKDKSIDVLVSVFVFHFNISLLQLSELYRILSDDGVMIFNLYLLPQKQRKNLFLQLEKIGFVYHRELDSEQLCKNHEYCVLARNSNSLLYKKAVKLFGSSYVKPSDAYEQHGLLNIGDIKKRDQLSGLDGKDNPPIIRSRL